MQFAEGISFVTSSLSISRGKIFGHEGDGLRVVRRLFVSVRNSAQVSDIRCACMFLDFARLLVHIPLDWMIQNR